MTSQPGYASPMGGAAVVQQTTTTTFAPAVTQTFGRAVQLWNLHGKFLCGGDHKPHGHHNPHYGYNQSSYWYIEPHEGYSDKVRLKNTNGKYLCHDGHSGYAAMHHQASHKDVAWHMDSTGSSVVFRSHGGHYLGCDSGEYDHAVHCRNEGSAHRSQQFEVRYV